MKEQFVEAIKEGEIVFVRLFLSNELLLDPRGDSFDEMLEYAESHCPNLYENYDSTFNTLNDSNQWNQQYLNDLKNEIDTHFEKKLLKHYKEVALVVLKDKAAALNTQEQETYNKKSNAKIYKRIACGTLLAGGVALMATGFYLTKETMIRIGVASLITGSFFAYKLIKK